MRLFVAVLTGYMVFAVASVLLFQLTLHDPRTTPSLMFGIMSVAWGIWAAGLGGYVAVRIARPPTLLASIVVGCLIAVGALASLIADWGSASMWSQVSTMLLMAPAACGGGRLALRK